MLKHNCHLMRFYYLLMVGKIVSYKILVVCIKNASGVKLKLRRLSEPRRCR